MRLGIFGGTFDPVHFGHLILAEQCREQARLDSIWFVPCARHPLKTEQTPANFVQRVAMLEAALAGLANYRIEQLENERTGPSYTADTLDELQRRNPKDELFLLLGSDTLAELPQWREPRRIIERATLVVMERHPWPPANVDDLRRALSLPAEIPLRLQRVEVPLIDISSRDIRRRVREGRSIRFMVPAEVEDFIGVSGLYKS